MPEGRLSKPKMRGLVMTHVKKHLVGMIVTSVLVGIIYKFSITEPLQRKYDTFYKNYDAEAALKVMNEAGLMQSYKK